MSNAYENTLKLQSVVDVRAYGARGNGTTDDTTAIQTALNTARRVFFPEGTYRITSTLTIPENTVLVGEGRRNSIIEVDAAIIGASKVYGSKLSTNVMKIEIRGLGFQGTATALGALHFDKGDHVVIDSCDFFDFTANNGYGIKLTNVYHWQVSNCKFENIKAFGLSLLSASSVGCNAGICGPNNDFIGNNQASFIGIGLDRGQNILIYGNNIEGSGNGNKGIDLNGTDGVLIQQNYIEQWVSGAIVANSGLGNSRVTIEQNVIHATATNICNFNDVSVTNNLITFRGNRFADATGSQTCVVFGSSTNVVFQDNDPASGTPADTHAASPRSVQALTGTTTWNPGNIADGGRESTTLTVTGASVGDPCVVTHDQIGTRDMHISGHVQATNTVRVVLVNREGAPVDLGSGTVRAWVFKP